MIKAWRLDDLSEYSLDLDDETDRNGGETLLAFVAELAEQGIEIENIGREIDAEDGEMVCWELILAQGSVLHAHFPGVPLEWIQRPDDFVAEWGAWGNHLREMFIQHHGYEDWGAAVDAGVVAAQQLIAAHPASR